MTSDTISPMTIDDQANDLFAGYLTDKQLAEKLNVTLRTVQRWEALRCGPPRVKIGARVFYKIESVRAWIAAKEQQPAASATRRRRGGV